MAPSQASYTSIPSLTAFTMLFSIFALAAVSAAAAVPDAAHLDARQTCRIATQAELQAARDAFLREEIIPPTPAQFDRSTPNLIPDFRPKSALSVSYGNKAVELGNIFSTLGKSSFFSLFFVPQTHVDVNADLKKKTTETINAPSFSFTAEPDFGKYFLPFFHAVF